jgi:spermidine synthase
MAPNTKVRHGFAHALAVWLLVFTAGWFVMLTELVGARVLSPYFGNSIYVWGSVIAIFLLALAVGYAVGGRMTQRFRSPLVPTCFAAAAGIYVALTPLYHDGLSSALYNTGMHAKWAALLATIALYAVPMALLGAISPYMIQLATKTHSEVGSRAGMLYAVSTVGSFVGCLLTAFILIPSFALSQILIWGGTAMAGIAVITALALADRIVPAAVMAVALVLLASVAAYRQPDQAWRSEMKAYEYPLKGRTLSALSPEELRPEWTSVQKEATAEAAKYMFAGPKTLLEIETPYHHLVVNQEGPVRELVFGKTSFRGAQNEVDLRNLSWHIGEYTQLAFAGLLYGPAPKRVCVIGIGGAVIPRALELCFPGVQIDAIDIDPTVIDVAQKYFFWRPSKNVRVYAQDGRSFLNLVIVNRKPLYDWVILDAYEEDYVPFHLTTQEFVYTVRRALKPGGIVASNMTIDNDLYGCEARTLKGVFGNASAFAGHRTGNVILMSQNGRTKPLTPDEAGEASKKLSLPQGCGIDPRFLLSCLVDGQNWSDEGPVLTDSWAPAENLLR